ncbi:pksN [Symbiodinium natans]|uniref:PksN protein n=1 Tax=Symbiodinium natans TaxID=878477 RepID=A0A812TWF7_9DINO|nr:pksN [Symbiodinium natans]
MSMHQEEQKEKRQRTNEWNTLDLIPVSADIARRETHKMTAAGQARAIQVAMNMLGEDPWSISYVECHCTGTRIGDGIEAVGLGFTV